MNLNIYLENKNIQLIHHSIGILAPPSDQNPFPWYHESTILEQDWLFILILVSLWYY
jgi:hypothetical protein